MMILGMSIATGSSSPGIANLDVIFCVDTTASMGALDYEKSRQRIVGVKRDMLEIGSRVQGAHLSIISFDSNVEPLLPSTSDYGTFVDVSQNITPEIYNTSSGSSIDSPIEQLTKQLKDSKAAYPDRQRLVFFFSDGEQTSDTEVKSFDKVAGFINGGAVLGYGTAAGAKMVKYTGLSEPSETTYITTPKIGRAHV
jgi:Ca-activated chloride channel family protein